MKDSPVRQNIIETASNLFYQNGYSLTGINEIIRESGIAKATLYNHFQSKDDIGVAYINYQNTQFLSSLKEYISGKPEGESQITGLFDFLDLFFQEKDFNGCWCINTVSEIPRENKKIRTEIQYQKKQFIEYIEGLVNKNLSPRSLDERIMLSRKIYLLYEGAIAESHLHQEKWPIQVAAEMCKQVI